jgi:large repetitive protein
MSITVDLNGAGGGTDTATAFTEQTIVSLFSSATISTTSSDSGNTIDTVTVTLGSATGTENLSLSAAASAAATTAGITATYNSGTGVLTLSGSNKSSSNWQTVLQGVQYNNTSEHPDGAKNRNRRRY